MTDTPTIDDEAQLIAQADAHEAEAAKLEQAILEGDLSVELEDLEEAQRRGRFARLKAQGARARRERAAERARMDRAAALRDLIVNEFGRDEQALVDLFNATVVTAGHLIDAVLGRNGAIRSIREEVIAVGESDVSRVDHGFCVDEFDVEIHPIDPEELVAEAVVRALIARGQGHTATLKTSTAVHPTLPVAQAFGVEPGEVFGHSDRLRRTVGIVTARDAA